MGASKSGDLRIVGEQKMDQQTQNREANLYAKANRLAETNPYSSAYGVGSDLPGMGAMSQAGQQYLTDSILGRNAYQSQNLGFSPYERPEGAAVAADATIAASQEAAAAAAAEARAREAAERKRIEGEFGSGPGDEFSKKGAYDTYGGSMGLLTSGSGGPSGYGSSGVGIGEMQDAALATRNMLRERGPTPQAYQSISASEVRGPNVSGAPRVQAGRVNQPGGNYVSQTSPQNIGQTRVGSVSDIRNDGQYSAPRGFNLGLGLDRNDAFDTKIAAQGGYTPYDPRRLNASSVAATNIGSPTDMTLADDGTQTSSPNAFGGIASKGYATFGEDGKATDNFSTTPETIRGPLGLTPAELTEKQLKATTLDAFDPSVSSTAIDPLSANAFAGEQSAKAITSVGVGELTGNPAAGEMTQAQLNALGIQKADTISPVGSVGVDPVTGQTTRAVDGVSPMDFGGSQTFGGTNSIQDYMNTAGVDAQIAQAKQDYNEALNVEKSRQAQVGAFGARGTVKEAGLIGDQERNIAQIRGAGFDRAAQMMEADAGRRQQAGLQGQQLGVQTGLAGQQLEAQRRESDAARAQQAAMQGQQLGFQGQLQSQQLTQAGDTRSAELTMQSQLQAQQLEAQRRESNAARTQQGALQTQQLGMQGSLEAQDLEARRLDANANRLQQAGIQTQQLGMQSGLAGQALQAQRAESNAARAQQAALQGQQLGSQQQMQTQQLAQVGDIRNAELGLQADMQAQSIEANRLDANADRTQQAGIQTQQLAQAADTRNAELALQSDMQTQQLGMQGQIATQGQRADIEAARQQLGTQAAMQTQALGSDAYMQSQQLGTQVGLQNAQNQMRAAEQNQQVALQRGDRQAQIDAQRQMRTAELRSQQAMQTQQLGAQTGMQTQQLGTEVSVQNAQNQMRAAEQNQQAALQRNDQQAALDAQAQLANAEMRLTAATRNQASGLQARGMGLDADAQFRQQQLAAAGQLADIGGMTQDATFAGAGQLRQMGGEQDQIRRMQQAFDYEQWLRGQQGGAQSLALMQGFMPGGAQQQYERAPDLFGQLLGAGTSLAGAGLGAWGARG